MSEVVLALVRPFIRDYYNSVSSNSFESSIGLVPPLNLCSLAASAEEAGAKVLIYDCEAKTSSKDGFAGFLALHKPDFVGISVMTTNFRGALDTARIVRQILPETKILAGGTHLMIYPEETLGYEEFDFGFIGEGEKPLAEFLKQAKDQRFDPTVIQGLVYRQDSAIRTTMPWGLNPNLDDLPFPAYHLLDIDNYTMPNTGSNVITLYLTRGCPYNCGFCFRNDQLKDVRYKSVDRAIEEITYMVNRFGVRSINFVDEIITLKKRYFLEFCEKLSAANLGIEWQAPTRVNCVDDEIVKAAKASGCHTFRFGLESGSQEVLQRIEKPLKIEQSINALALCRKYGIKTVGYFIIGYLDETPKTMRETINFAKAHCHNYAAFFPATPMPGTQLYIESQERGIVPKDYWRKFVLGTINEPIPFVHPDAGEWTARAYREFYFNLPYMLRQLMTVAFWRRAPEHFVVAWRFLNMKFQRTGGRG